MLKRKRSSLAGGLTSSCRIKAEALARAFNSRIWPCTWRSSASVRGVRQDEDEEFYEASSADDEEDRGGRDLSEPCLTITSEQGRAKFCELLHAVDDATDVFYDVIEHAGLSEVGKVIERPAENPIHEVELHKSGENSNCESSSSDCLKYAESCETSNDMNDHNHLSTEPSCHIPDAVSTFDKPLIDSKFEDNDAISNNVNDYNRSSKDHSCSTSNDINTFDKSLTECSKFEDRDGISNDVNDYKNSSKEHDCSTSNDINTFDKSLTECSKFQDRYGISNDVNDYKHSSKEHSCPSSNDMNIFDKSCTQISEIEDGFTISNSINGFTQSENECLKIDDSCKTFNVINIHEQSSNECLRFSDNRDNPINCEAFKNINDINAPESSSSSGDCLNNKIGENNCDSVTYFQNIHGADKSINLISSTECLIGHCSSDCPSEIDSGTATDKVNIAHKSINVTSSLECLKSPVCVDQLINFNCSEISKIESTVKETNNLSYSFECITDKNDLKSISNECFEHGNSNCSTEFTTHDLCPDILGDSDLEKICICTNSIATSKSLNNNCSEHIDLTNIPSIINNPEHSIPTTMNFVDPDVSSYDNEELLTIIIDSNSIDILQTPHNNLETIPSSIDQCLVEQSHTPVLPDSSNSNNDQGATDPLADCPTSTQELNDICISTLNNDCIASELHRLELSEDGQSQVLVSSECLNCNNDQEAIISSNEPIYPILFEITKEGSSPIRKNDFFKFSELESLENNIPGDDCRLKVFDEQRPMISRSTSLKTGKTPPGTPSRKKIVRFADVLGLDLEDVRHIISGDLPNIPSSAYSDLVLAKDSTSPTAPQTVVVDLSCRQQASWESIPATAGPNALYPLFAIPGLQPDFMERLRSGGVCLESVVIEDCNVQCTCRVMNWGYNKRVLARYTTNGWSSSSDINASYVSGSTRDGTDSFAFNIFLNRERSDLQFAIRFEINGNEYWDNNGGKNYCFSYHSNGTSQTSVPCSPTWMEFW